MKTLALTLLVIFSTVSLSIAGEYVSGYTKKDGTYVNGYYRSSKDNSTFNNYSTKGNTNPYTGKKGTKNPYSSTYNKRN